MIIENKKLKTKLFDKKNAFHFLVIFLPHLNCNIPSNSYYVSIGSDILKFPRRISDSNNFRRQQR